MAARAPTPCTTLVDCLPHPRGRLASFLCRFVPFPHGSSSPACSQAWPSLLVRSGGSARISQAALPLVVRLQPYCRCCLRWQLASQLGFLLAAPPAYSPRLFSAPSSVDGSGLLPAGRRVPPASTSKASAAAVHTKKAKRGKRSGSGGGRRAEQAGKVRRAE